MTHGGILVAVDIGSARFAGLDYERRRNSTGKRRFRLEFNRATDSSDEQMDDIIQLIADLSNPRLRTLGVSPGVKASEGGG